MQDQEKQLIDDLFGRLRQTEQQSAPRDASAEEQIQKLVQQQPNAPYYMAQAILVQEAALKKLQAQVSDLEQRLTQAEQGKTTQSGSFLSNLFGRGRRQSAQPPNYTAAPPPSYGPPPTTSQGTGFLGGALQTAAGVAGGVMVAEMLTGLFHHSQPQEIVNIINEPTPPIADDNGNDSSFFADSNANWTPGKDYSYNDSGTSDFDGGWGDDDNYT